MGVQDYGTASQHCGTAKKERHFSKTTLQKRYEMPYRFAEMSCIYADFAVPVY